MAIRVFKVNEDHYWVGDCTKEEILADYMETFYQTHVEATGSIDKWPTVVSKQKMEESYMVDSDEEWPGFGYSSLEVELEKLIKTNTKFPCALNEWY